MSKIKTQEPPPPRLDPEQFRARNDAYHRPAFERWIQLPPIELSVRRMSDDENISSWPGQYRDGSVELAWEAWCEAAAPSESVRSLQVEIAHWKAVAGYKQSTALQAAALANDNAQLRFLLKACCSALESYRHGNDESGLAAEVLEHVKRCTAGRPL